MSSSRKLALLGFVLILLMVGAGALSRWSRPESPNHLAIPEEMAIHIQKVAITYKEAPLVLELKSGKWRLTAPIEDHTEGASSTDQLLDALAKMELGSVISEKEEKHPNFELDQAQASHVMVYVSSRTEPILDIYVGKTGEMYDEAYVRLKGQAQVRLAKNCPVYIFRQPYQTYLLKPESR